MLPDDARDQLARSAEHHGFGLTEAQIGALLAHVAMLERWGKTYNLTAVREADRMVAQHVIDSLSLVRPLTRHLGHAASARILDVGSGAGFPGLTLAIALPQVQVICVDSVGKKAGFMRQVIAELGLTNARAEHGRVEQLPSLSCDLVTSRAFASLNDFTTLSRRHLNGNGCWVAMKGQRPTSEMAELPATVEVFHVEQLDVSQLAAERCLVWMRPAVV